MLVKGLCVEDLRNYHQAIAYYELGKVIDILLAFSSISLMHQFHQDYDYILNYNCISFVCANCRPKIVELSAVNYFRKKLHFRRRSLNVFHTFSLMLPLLTFNK